MSRVFGVPMPAELRQWQKSQQHPARSVPCAHCGAAEGRPCRSQNRTRQMPQPHPSRVTAWATATAVCPACQVEPTVPCHIDGMPFRTSHVHPQRETEARRTAA
jgi:hypothetical protein